jgi:hypothetical protein
MWIVKTKFDRHFSGMTQCFPKTNSVLLDDNPSTIGLGKFADQPECKLRVADTGRANHVLKSVPFDRRLYRAEDRREGVMIRHHFAPLLLVVSVTLGAAAQQAPAARAIDLEASDGTLLKATYFAAAKSGPGVLLLHQCNRQRKVWDDLAVQLAAARLNVLTFDLRGFGESGGTPFDS